ncbi:hypothetical protein GCM10010358_80750 [Streptomyces minutiscleroticus]|uniref:Uncharacterized protein n=2 Tax=Streptomyces minutiscleroticus TaxID=68238 RepID=A0A918P3J8_9ACTN|nr:hypothetical protein GCM10010358_80750 [Streptomyces minutiscleroticus]
MEEAGEDHDDGTVARVAAIDIAKASGMVCLRIPHDTVEGRRVQKVWTHRLDDEHDPRTR